MTPEEQLFNQLNRLGETISPKYAAILLQLYHCYEEASGQSPEVIAPYFSDLIQLVLSLHKTPYPFRPYHQKVRSPIDYYQFGRDFFRPIVDLAHSKVFGEENLQQIEKNLRCGENVVLLSNHQTESDPQAISLLLEKSHPFLAEKIIYVAGERVVTDPLAIPFSMGCDLLCIYSKRYIDHPPEQKAEKQLHNKNTMELMSRLLREGGKIIYVAPSGGRDRPNEKGIVEVAPFDAASIELFYLMAKKAKTPTHFHPFTLSTYDLFPPPQTVQKELGEVRSTRRCPIHLFFASEFDMEKFPGSEENDKSTRRLLRADAIWKIVKENYERILTL